MDIMNLIHDICLTKNRINNIPKWKFILRNKEIKKLNEDISKFMDLPIISASDNIISFLLSLDRKITKNITGGYVMYNFTYIAIDIFDNNKILTNVIYYPRTNQFEVANKNVSFTIYPNSRINNNINKIWEPLKDKIKKRYLDIIIQMAEYTT